LPHIRGNIGFVFTKEELVSVRDMLLANKVRAPARAGAIAPLDVTVPAQNTGLGPEKTSFFQALNIPTKITKGTIEIVQDISLIKSGDKVGMSEATLLNMLNISPFTYGLVVQKVYDSGTVFDPAILDITEADLRAKFMSGVARVAALSLAIKYPTVASVPHSIVNGLKNCLAIAAVTEITFKEAEKVCCCGEFLCRANRGFKAVILKPNLFAKINHLYLKFCYQENLHFFRSFNHNFDHMTPVLIHMFIIARVVLATLAI
jgi:large subunit ribosomal protein LP0